MNPGVGCYRCHRVDMGPPLTFIGEEQAHRLLESLFDPNVDVVWSARIFDLKDGSNHTGMVKERAEDGSIRITNTIGQTMTLAGKEIVKESSADASLMPDGLLETTTVQGIRDLFAFLRTLK
jgi:putative heme-binding domain-containing protein